MKTDDEGKLDTYEGRVVAKRYWQTEGFDDDETLAPIVHFKSVRALVALSASMGWELDQMDVATTFLHAKLEEEMCVEGVVSVGGDGRIWRLKKCLYVLKQSPRMWNMTMDKPAKGVTNVINITNVTQVLD